MGLLLGIGLLAGAAAHVWHFRPLLRSPTWTARVTQVDQGSVEVPVYQMLFRSHLLFIELPVSHREGFGAFLIDTQRRTFGATGLLERSWYPYRRHDQRHGLSVTSGKIGLPGTVSWLAEGVTFSNASLTVTLTPRPSSLPP